MDSSHLHSPPTSLEPHHVELRLRPVEGTPPVASTEAELAEVAASLSTGWGPLAVDTERASAYRYDDRVFLLQLRRSGAGTFLIDAEATREYLGILGVVINPLTWIIHAAPSDLPALAAAGLFPARLFDTELAGRLIGVTKVNLAALTEQFLGVGLAKGHGREDWSQRPLPTEWLDYAALDVELLIDLAEVLGQALAELGRLEWLEQECSRILLDYARFHAGLDIERHWQNLKGVKALRQRIQTQLAFALWTEREAIAKARDINPASVLPHKVIIDIARETPRTRQQLAAVKGFPRRRRGATNQWWQVISTALAEPEEQWPEPIARTPSATGPQKKDWAALAPAAAALYDAAYSAITAIAAQLGLAQDTVITTTQLRELVWWWHSGAVAKQKAFPRASYGDALAPYLELVHKCQQLGLSLWRAELVAGTVAAQVRLIYRYPAGVTGNSLSVAEARRSLPRGASD